MVGLYFAVGSNNHLPPWGGSESLLGTNPIAISAPATRNRPFLLDMATATVAANKLKVNSTPTFFVNGTKVDGAVSIEDFAKVIDPYLKGG